MMVVSFLCHGFRHQKSSWKRRSLGFFVRFPRNVSILNPVFAHSCRNFTARLTDLVKENSSDWSGPFKSGVMRFFVELRDTVYLIQRPIPVAYIYIYKSSCFICFICIQWKKYCGYSLFPKWKKTKRSETWKNHFSSTQQIFAEKWLLHHHPTSPWASNPRSCPSMSRLKHG